MLNKLNTIYEAITQNSLSTILLGIFWLTVSLTILMALLKDIYKTWKDIINVIKEKVNTILTNNNTIKKIKNFKYIRI